MTNTQSKTANMIGGKTARACDSCLRKRARWFCAADDAFLCQSCDTSVHSANLLASRHERVRLETASWKNNKQIKVIGDDDDVHESTSFSSSWHQGFTKKPRTPRSRHRVQQQQHEEDDEDDQKKRKKAVSGDLVPEISSNEDENEEEKELLLYRVPVLDPFATTDQDQVPFEMDDFDAIGMEIIPGFISTDDIELQELNSLLGNDQIEEDSCGIKGLLHDNDCFEDNNMLLKIEEENQELEGHVMDTTAAAASESFNWDFDYSKSPITNDGDEDDDLRIMSFDFPPRGEEDFEMMNIGKEKKRINLKINYEQVIAAWDCQGCPWTNGVKPDFNPDDCWPDFMETGSRVGENVGRSGHGGCWDREREARVLRYKEKRRKRLFAKKIRYEVRKLNAEKRPRLKGRFVKRTSFLPSSSFYPHAT